MANAIMDNNGASKVWPGSITQESLAPNVAGNGPCFSAYQSISQTGLISGVPTKVAFQTKEYDPTQSFSTSSIFKPGVAGYYNFILQVYPITATTASIAYLYKNNANVKRRVSYSPNDPAIIIASIYLGVDDFVEGWAAFTGASPAIGAMSDLTFFQGFLARAA